MVRNSLKL